MYSARSSLNMCLSPWVGCQVGKPSLISHLEQEEELRTEERGLPQGTCPGKHQANTSASEYWLYPVTGGGRASSKGHPGEFENAHCLLLPLYSLIGALVSLSSHLGIWHVHTDFFFCPFIVNILGHILSVLSIGLWRIIRCTDIASTPVVARYLPQPHFSVFFTPVHYFCSHHLSFFRVTLQKFTHFCHQHATIFFFFFPSPYQQVCLFPICFRLGDSI